MILSNTRLDHNSFEDGQYEKALETFKDCIGKKPDSSSVTRLTATYSLLADEGQIKQQFFRKKTHRVLGMRLFMSSFQATNDKLDFVFTAKFIKQYVVISV
jgi:hypothetical protein